MKKSLFILKTYGFQSKVLDKKKTIEKNYQIFNTLDKNWTNYFYNNLKQEFKVFKDYPNLSKIYYKNKYYEFLKEKIIKHQPDLIFSSVNDHKIDNLLKNFKSVKKLIWISYQINSDKLKKIKETYDYIISSNKLVLLFAKKERIKSYKMSISAPKFCNLKEKDFQKRKNEIIFTGSLGHDFSKRLKVLLFLQDKFKISVRLRNLVEKFFILNSINYFLIKLFPNLTKFLYNKKILPFTNKLKNINKNEVFGINMLNEMQKFKFCLNIHSNFDSNQNVNARVYEALSCGCLLFNEENDTMKKIFKNKKHVIYFSSEKDLLSKLNYYKKNLSEAYKIAKEGNDLFINKYQSSKRLKDFKKILYNIL